MCKPSKIKKLIKRSLIFGILSTILIATTGCSVIYQNRLESMTNHELSREYNRVSTKILKDRFRAQGEFDKRSGIVKFVESNDKSHQKSFDESPVLTTITDVIFGKASAEKDEQDEIDNYSITSASFDEKTEIGERKLSQILSEMNRRNLIISDFKSK